MSYPAALPPAPGSVRWCPKQDDRPQRGCWSPGEYMNVCLCCGEHFLGDKRAGQCADCAYIGEKTPNNLTAATEDKP